MKRFKKFFRIILVCAVFSLTLGGCNTLSGNISPTDCCNEIIRCLEEKDKESLKNIFCSKTLSGYSDLNDEIDKAMNFFEGQAVSYDNFQYPSGSKKENGKWVEYDFSPYMNNIKTDKNKTYNIKFYLITVYEAEPERVGVSEISITDENGEKCLIGDYYYVNPEYIPPWYNEHREGLV